MNNLPINITINGINLLVIKYSNKGLIIFLSYNNISYRILVTAHRELDIKITKE